MHPKVTAAHTSQLVQLPTLSTFEGIETCERALVQVELRMRFRGTPDDNALIYIPSTEDLDAMRGENARDWEGVEESLPRKSSNALELGQARNVLGCIVRGKFSHIRGFGFGIGFVALSKIVECSHLRQA
jgi:hypothetical protein